MVKETISLHEALSELKILDNRIESLINDSNFIAISKENNTKINGVSIDEYKKELKGNLQKVNDLIKRRNAIKKSLVVANANIKINVDNQEMTLAEAIDLKQIGIGYKGSLLTKLKIAFNSANTQLTINNKELEKQADMYIQSVFGNKENQLGKDNEIAITRENYIKPLTTNLIDPNQLSKIITLLEEEISSFNSKVDGAISVANALNTIEIEY